MCRRPSRSSQQTLNGVIPPLQDPLRAVPRLRGDQVVVERDCAQRVGPLHGLLQRRRAVVEGCYIGLALTYAPARRSVPSRFEDLLVALTGVALVCSSLRLIRDTNARGHLQRGRARDREADVSEDYVREKLYVAMCALAVSTSSLQHRLADAGVSALVRLEAEDFVRPDDRVLFERIMSALTSREGGSEGRIAASTEAMDDEAAMSVARDLAELHGRFFPITR